MQLSWFQMAAASVCLLDKLFADWCGILSSPAARGQLCASCWLGLAESIGCSSLQCHAGATVTAISIFAIGLVPLCRFVGHFLPFAPWLLRRDAGLGTCLGSMALGVLSAAPVVGQVLSTCFCKGIKFPFPTSKRMFMSLYSQHLWK